MDFISMHTVWVYPLMVLCGTTLYIHNNEDICMFADVNTQILYCHFGLMDYLQPNLRYTHDCCNVVLFQCSSSSFKFKSFSIKFGIWNNSLSSDVLYIQASISPKYESKSKTTSHCHLLLHDCTNAAV